MEKYWNIFIASFTDYGNYLWLELLNPHWGNYFYWLIALSLLFWMLEIIMPWRKGQHSIRQDFWLDGFYMFFNFFLFSLIGFNAISNIAVNLFNDFLKQFELENLIAFEIQSWPVWTQLLMLFVVRDFIQWNVHRLLHRSDFLWRFHKLHHSVQEMGFAAHLRFHWGETIIYRTLEYIPLAMIGFGIQDFFLVHIFATAVGHFNHSNIQFPLGPLRYILNNPQMHIWHHARQVHYHYGVNFGISLSVWDYIFKTAYIPEDGRDIALGFDAVEKYPKSFLEQQWEPFREGGTGRAFTDVAEEESKRVGKESQVKGLEVEE